VAYPLPGALHFLYPLLRLPLWAWRRAGWGIAVDRKHQDRAKP
jgi:hypothetical protein